MSQNAKHILFLSIKESVFFAEQKKEHKKKPRHPQASRPNQKYQIIIV